MKIREWLFKKLFRAEYREFHHVRGELLVEESKHQKCRQSLNFASSCLEVARDEATKLRAARTPPARFKLEVGLPPEEIAQRLAGQEKNPLMLAIVAHLSAKIVTLADAATDAPRGATTLRDGSIIPAFGSQEREHLSGQASGVAEILAELQQLTAPREEEPEGKQ